MDVVVQVSGFQICQVSRFWLPGLQVSMCSRSQAPDKVFQVFRFQVLRFHVPTFAGAQVSRFDVNCVGFQILVSRFQCFEPCGLSASRFPAQVFRFYGLQASRIRV